VVSVRTKLFLVHIVEVLLSNHQVSSGTHLTCHKGSTTKAHARSPGHLDAAFATELPTKEKSPHPPHKAVVAAPHQDGGPKTCQ
jgi:hypothetical protein